MNRLVVESTGYLKTETCVVSYEANSVRTLQWWREHPDEIPDGLDASIPVEGLVVVGRNNDLSDQDKLRLLHLNSTRDVKLITYGELLEKLEVLIQNLESLALNSNTSP